MKRYKAICLFAISVTLLTIGVGSWARLSANKGDEAHFRRIQPEMSVDKVDEAHFRRILPGMGEDQVRHIVGRPPDGENDLNDVFPYLRPKNDNDDLVVEKIWNGKGCFFIVQMDSKGVVTACGKR